MSNVSNNYFSSVAQKTKSNIKCFTKHYSDYLSNTNTNAFFLPPTDKNEIFSIISSLHFHESSDPNSYTCEHFKTLN